MLRFALSTSSNINRTAAQQPSTKDIACRISSSPGKGPQRGRPAKGKWRAVLESYVQKAERDNSQSHCHWVAVSCESVNERKGKKVKNQRCDGSYDVRSKEQIDEEESKYECREPNTKSAA